MSDFSKKFIFASEQEESLLKLHDALSDYRVQCHFGDGMSPSELSAIVSLLIHAAMKFMFHSVRDCVLPSTFLKFKK